VLFLIVVSNDNYNIAVVIANPFVPVLFVSSLFLVRELEVHRPNWVERGSAMPQLNS
jgi:hypothetical protein